MAAQYNAPFDEPAEVREGFLCPLCLKDLQSFYQLQSHYEEEHSTEDWDVKGQLKSEGYIHKTLKNNDCPPKQLHTLATGGGWADLPAGNSVQHQASVSIRPGGERMMIRSVAASCKDTLMKREMQMDEKAHTPEIVKKLRACMERVDEKAPEYIRMAQSINAGETTYNLDHANNLRIEVQRLYELIDALSKKILTLGLNEEPKPHPKNLQLQKMVRYSATLFVQEKLLGLMSLPTKEKYEELKEKRKRENELKLQREQQAALEAQRRRDEKRKDFVPRSSDVLNGEPQQAGRIRKVEGWLPTSGVPRNRETSDPLLQQIENITSYIQQAQAAGRVDEVHMLQENLRQLQDEYDQQQVETAIRMSRELAEGEAMQREQLEVLRKREESREQRKSLSQHSRAHSLDFRDHRQVTVWQDKHTAALDLQLPRRDPIPAELSPPLTPPDTRPILPLRISPVLPNKSAPLNPFEDEESEPEPAAAEKIQQNGSKEYNPFDEDEEENPEEAAESVQGVTQVSSNPFETSPERDYTAPGPTNPFEEEEDGPCPGNPFEESDDLGANEEEVIEEDLLLQQIDNIKAYIFDAKHSGRLDEVDLLTENLRELKKTLAKQKGQK
ncbi:hypothetical protein GDO81_023782 [Engystomops pustulosus]|uniref:C2H2-type domain-containing protein n=1 Tax=Engystomops pustulosus TaxID=76066 RepID=A0AAV6ZHS7_ENGPU|nr:hypothetical protein GDO81_023782 [Engystomops pustulosus]